MEKASSGNEPDGGDETKAAPSPSALESATPHEFASYVFETNASLRHMADAKGFDFLTYLIEMVIHEAARIRDQ